MSLESQIRRMIRIQSWAEDGYGPEIVSARWVEKLLIKVVAAVEPLVMHHGKQGMVTCAVCRAPTMYGLEREHGSGEPGSPKCPLADLMNLVYGQPYPPKDLTK
jgi:hypothetical protein